ncbi:MAG TPA: hypothetical protein VLE20_06000, partial [Blastocatellia bacterium]|nr:hypothetical protein [Blastocatellia bacterium]
IAGKDGTAVEWRPLNGSSDLPTFVYDTSRLSGRVGLRHLRSLEKGAMEALVRMETPVLYFYADKETTVSVRVDFPKGKITEWYPQARGVYNSDYGGAIDWGRMTVLPGAEVELPIENPKSHYYPARETDAALLRVCGEKPQEHEKFLFYRGVGTFDLPLSARLADESIVVKNLGKENVAQFILFENRGGRVGYRISDLFKGEVALERPALDQTIESLARDLEILLVANGLYEKEAGAMIKTWRDSWFEEGLRVFYIVPRKLTDSILPIRIDPAPAELTRVLVGRMEVITPETEEAIRQQVARLRDSSADIRDQAAKIIRKHGRFSEPVLKSIREKTSDVKLRARIDELIIVARGATD